MSAREPLTVAADLILDVVPRTVRRIRAEMRAGGTETGASEMQAPRMSVPQVRALLYVRRHAGCGLSALAEHVGVSLAAASALVDRLVRAGLLERTTDPAERRRIRLHLTPDGLARMTHAQERARASMTHDLAELGPGDLATLVDGLRVLDRLTVTRRHGPVSTRPEEHG